MYQALYRKYRPQTFDDVIGQGHITQTLKNQVQSGHLSHAYIFIGTRGTGKTTCARILAKAVNCEHPVNGNPCCKCDTCKGISDGSIMDIVELDAASNNGVDNVRALRDEAVFSPANAKKRVYIIDEVHMLSTPAFNALLKILEEPPEHLIFVLATTELQKVPATILSRCQRHVFKRIDLDELSSYLESIAKKENLGLSHEAARLIAGLGEGSVRDSLSILDQCSDMKDIDTDAVYSSVGLAGNKRISSLYGAILEKDVSKAVSEFDKMWTDGKDPTVVLKELSNLNRDVLMLKVAPKAAYELVYGGYDKDELEKFANCATVNKLCFIGDELTRTLGSIVNPKMNVELCLVKLASSDNLVNAEQLKIEKSENTIPKVADKPNQTKGTELNNKTQTTDDKPPFDIDEPANPMPAKPDIDGMRLTSKKEEPVSATLELTGNDADYWHNVCCASKPDLPFDIGLQLNDTSIVVGKLDGDTLVISVVPGFIYSRFNRQEILSVFAKAASDISGKIINVRICELSSQQKTKRDLDELKNFSEVNFI